MIKRRDKIEMRVSIEGGVKRIVREYREVFVKIEVVGRIRVRLRISR